MVAGKPTGREKSRHKALRLKGREDNRRKGTGEEDGADRSSRWR